MASRGVGLSHCADAGTQAAAVRRPQTVSVYQGAGGPQGQALGGPSWPEMWEEDIILIGTQTHCEMKCKIHKNFFSGIKRISKNLCA